MTLDWVSRTVYATKGDDMYSSIVQYQMDLDSHNVLLSRHSKIGDIVVDPYTGWVQVWGFLCFIKMSLNIDVCENQGLTTCI